MTKQTDYVAVAMAKDDQIVAYAATTRNLVEELRQRHDTWPVTTAALGRVATVAAVLTCTLKSDQHQVTLQIHGDGPAGKILVVAMGDGSVRGYVDEPHVDLPLNAQGKLDVGGAVGREGSLYVVKDLGLKSPYRGTVPLISGEIGEDFTYYFTISEQTPSAVAVGVLVDVDTSVAAAGGLFIHALPGAASQDLETIEQTLARWPSVTSLLRDGYTPEDLLQQVLGDDVRILARRPVSFKCSCSRDRLARVLLSLGKQEIDNLIREQGHAELICHFCSSHYEFDVMELSELSNQASQ